MAEANLTQGSQALSGGGSQAVGQGLLSSKDLVRADIKDELELAVGDMNSSGLISKGMLDEMRNDQSKNHENEEDKKSSGRFQQQATLSVAKLETPERPDSKMSGFEVKSKLQQEPPVSLVAGSQGKKKPDFDTIETFAAPKASQQNAQTVTLDKD